MIKFGARLVAGDVLMFEEVPHVLLACVVLDECLNFLVQPCSPVRTQGAGSIWMPLDARVLLQEPIVSYLAYVRFCWEAPLFVHTVSLTLRFCWEALLFLFTLFPLPFYN